MAKQWYVIHTYAGHENKVKSNLEKAIHSAGLEDKFGLILVATEDFAEMRDGKRTISRRKTLLEHGQVCLRLRLDTTHGGSVARPEHQPRYHHSTQEAGTRQYGHPNLIHRCLLRASY